MATQLGLRCMSHSMQALLQATRRSTCCFAAKISAYDQRQCMPCPSHTCPEQGKVKLENLQLQGSETAALSGRVNEGSSDEMQHFAVKRPRQDLTTTYGSPRSCLTLETGDSAAVPWAGGGAGSLDDSLRMRSCFATDTGARGVLAPPALRPGAGGDSDTPILRPFFSPACMFHWPEQGVPLATAEWFCSIMIRLPMVLLFQSLQQVMAQIRSFR